MIPGLRERRKRDATGTLGVTAFNVDAQGRYRLRTVKPGAYPEPSGIMRTLHIHFEVINDDYRLVTQMYFPGEALTSEPAQKRSCPRWLSGYIR